jgi:hypothetical protein
MGEWSAPSSQLMVVAWCCSTRRSSASGTRSSPLNRAMRCFRRSASSSMPFIRMMRTRVNASSSSLLMGLGLMSFQVKRCRSSGQPFASKKLMFAMGLLVGQGMGEPAGGEPTATGSATGMPWPAGPPAGGAQAVVLRGSLLAG